MSNNFSNSGHDFLNYIQPMPHNIDQVGCRLCNRVFIGTQALIAHIESHIAQEEVAIRSLNSPNHMINSSQRSQFSQRFSPNLPMPIMPSLQEAMSFADSRQNFQSPPPAAGISHPRRNSYFNLGHAGASSSQLSPRQMLFPTPPLPISPQVMNWKAEECAIASDGTRAYIKQLEKPIKKIDFIDLENMDNDNSDAHALNLALKL